ncbi:MAG: response regulator transcription factor [Gemmatimonadota bacterium]
MNSQPTRVFFVEDHPKVLEIVRDFIAAIPDLQLCGVSSSAEEALETLPTATPDLVLVDTALGRMNGIDFVAEAQQRWPGLACLMLSGYGDEHYVARALNVGARGYVLKGDPSELPRAIRSVLGGGLYLSPNLRVPGRV